MGRTMKTSIAATAWIAALVTSAALPQEPKGYLTPTAQRTLGLDRQDPPSGSRPTVPRDPSKVTYDENGWPVFDSGGDAGPSPGRPSDFDPVVEPGASRPDIGARAPAPAGEGATPLPRGMGQVPAGSVDSPLADVFAAVGSPIRAQSLGGVRARWRMELMDARGAVVGGARELVHEAEFGQSSRDRLQLPGDLVFGRNEHGAFAERSGLPWPALDAAAGAHLDTQGMLLRFPWCFADSRTYSAFPAREAAASGESLVVYPIERDRRGPTAMGPTMAGVVDRFEIWCDPATRTPRELRLVVGATGAERRVRLSRWRALQGVGLMVPHRREITDGDGNLLMVLELQSLELGLDLPADQFRPR